jgi:hypothetical protein
VQQGDRLPDAGVGAVPGLLAVRDLLHAPAVGRRREQRRVRHEHLDGLLALDQQRAVDRQLEGRPAALVPTHVVAVHADLGAVVDRAEVQDQSPSAGQSAGR